jgi:signal peptidase
VARDDGRRSFVTKGDANEEPDPAPVAAENVIGVVPRPLGTPLGIPHMGRLLLFMQTQQGILMLVIVPAGLLVLNEVADLYRALTADGSPTTDESSDEHATTTEED